MSSTEKEIKRIRKNLPDEIAREINSVQPMKPENIDMEAIARSPLWVSFCNRHFK